MNVSLRAQVDKRVSQSRVMTQMQQAQQRDIIEHTAVVKINQNSSQQFTDQLVLKPNSGRGRTSANITPLFIALWKKC